MEKMVKKHKTRKNQQTFYNFNMYNNTIKITLYCITIRKATKGIKNIINAVDGQGITNNYERQSKDRSDFCAFVAVAAVMAAGRGKK